MSRIAMIVWNEFRNDARVLKEAQTLQGAGHDVTVFALHTPGVTLEHEVLEGGIKVSRVARSPFWKLRKAKVRSGQVGGNASIGRLSPARCGFHDTWTLSPRSFGHSFHAHLDT